MQLTERQRQMLDLRDSGVPVKVIAKQFEASPFTVQETLRVARIKLNTKKAQRGMSLLDAGKGKLLHLLASGPASSAKVREVLSEFSERQIQRLLNLATKAGLVASRSSGRYTQWYTAAMLEEVLKKEAAMFRGSGKSGVRLASNLPKGNVVIPDGVKITRIPAPPGRFEVTLPRGQGVISQDWKARRLAEVQQ